MAAQGGAFHHRRDESGHVLNDGSLALLRRLKRRGLIASGGGRPYRITRAGLAAVRGQLDNR